MLWKDWWAPAISPPEEVLTPVDQMLKRLQEYLGGKEVCQVEVEADPLSGEPMLVICLLWEGRKYCRKAMLDDKRELLDWELMRAFADLAQDDLQFSLDGGL
jgi:hypothetical protein